jgi:hypothetical protein
VTRINIVSPLKHSANMTDEPQTLKASFADAEAKRKSLDTIFDSGSDSYQEYVASAIAKYQECIRIAAEVSLFSSNETLEDIASSDLQFVSYALATSITRCKKNKALRGCSYIDIYSPTSTPPPSSSVYAPATARPSYSKPAQS